MYFECFSKNKSAKQILCEICNTDGLPVPATHFCKTYEDPETNFNNGAIILAIVTE